MSSPPDAPVVVRNRLVLRLAAIPLAVFAVAGWASVWEVAVSGDGGFGGIGRVVFGVLMSVVALTFTVAVLTGPLLKMTYADSEITTRVWFRTRRIELGTATEIRQVRAAVHTGVRQVPVGRLQIIGDRSVGLPVRAILDPAMTHWREALEVLDDWVRRRPELVSGERQAREAFVARGVLDPTDPTGPTDR